MNKENKLHFNTEPLFIDLNNIIQTGVNNLLSDFITNYKLYEETHNCIMNLPSVKREISKSIETYKNDEFPDLISMSSDHENDNEEKPCDSYTRIPIEDDLDQELNDTLLCMKKLTNQLLKEKEEINALFQEEINSYKEIIEKCNTEIADLKKQLTSNIIVCKLTDNNDEEEETIENIDIKVEKENIVLHIEEESNNDVLEEDDNTDEEDEEDDQAEEEEEEADDEEEEADDEEDEEDEEEEEQDEEEEEEVQAEAEEEQYEEVGDVEEVDEEEQDDEVETEESDDAELKNNEEQVEAAEEEEEELFEIEIDDVTYCTNDEENGFIYEIDNDGNVGNVIGHFKDSEPFFNKLF